MGVLTKEQSLKNIQSVNPVLYPITKQKEDLRIAFTNIGDFQNLIERIVDSIYTAEYGCEVLTDSL